jgi:hexosaminidase
MASSRTAVDEDTGSAVVQDFSVDLEGREVRYLRFTAKDDGPIPDWHPGRGEPRWIFADEIVTE